MCVCYNHASATTGVYVYIYRERERNCLYYSGNFSCYKNEIKKEGRAAFWGASNDGNYVATFSDLQGAICCFVFFSAATLVEELL